MKKIFSLVMAAVLLALLAGCGTADPLAELHIPESGYEGRFAPVASATLYADGQSQEIDADDPRLVRLLSFLAFAADEMLDSYTQGVVYQDNIDACYASGMTVLEVVFAVDDVNDHSLLDCPKILVSGDSYLLFLDPAFYPLEAEGDFAERHWPYQSLAPERAAQSGVSDWGGEYWLDILQYCGF